MADFLKEEPDTKIINGVIEGMKQSFLDEGVDLAVLEKLEALWMSKLITSGPGLSLRDVKMPANKTKKGKSRRKSSKSEDEMTDDTLEEGITIPDIDESGDEADLESEDTPIVAPSSSRTKKKKNKKMTLPQVDGPADSSDEDDGVDEDDDGDDDDDDDDSDINPDGDDDDEGVEEEPLGSEDDISDEDASDLFETDNVVVCQYDKITRARNKWKFHLKDGIMNLNGKDYVFQRANGDAEW